VEEKDNSVEINIKNKGNFFPNKKKVWKLEKFMQFQPTFLLSN